MRVVTAREMQEIDRRTIDGGLVPSLDRMERAGRAAASVVLRYLRARAGADAAGSPHRIAAPARGAAAGLSALLTSGADPDRGDAGGWTALHQAAEAGGGLQDRPAAAAAGGEP